jgi:MFS family permease
MLISDVGSASSIPGRSIPPHIADHIGHFNVITVCALSTAVSMLCLWLPIHYYPSHAGLIVFALIYGFVTGAVVSLLMPCVAKSGKIETLGVRFGTFQLVVAIGYVAGSFYAVLLNSYAYSSYRCLTGLPIMGAILNQQGGKNFAGLEIFAGVSALLGASLLSMSTYQMACSRGTWRV